MAELETYGIKSCLQDYPYTSKGDWDELAELERLAEIGLAAEKAFIYFSMGQPSENGTIEFYILDVESLLDWAKGGQP